MMGESLQPTAADITKIKAAWDRDIADWRAQVEVLTKALQSARAALMVAIRANVDLPDFDPASTTIIQLIDTALAE